MTENHDSPVTYLQNCDPVIGELIRKFDLPEPSSENDLYVTLLRSVVGQQLSVKAAATIFNRFLLLFPDGYPAPEKIAALPDEQLRQAGLSGQKAGYIRAIALFKQNGGLESEIISHLPDEELIQHLTRIKGVGRWTAEMLLMFALNRPDVFPVDDLGIKNAMVMQYGLKQEGRELKKKLSEISVNWKPYRTLACRYLWKSLDNI